MTTAMPDSPHSIDGSVHKPDLQETRMTNEAQTSLRNPKPEMPDVSVLEDRMPLWFRSTKAFAAIAIVLAVFFTFLCFRPLWHSDLWGHLAYGRLMWESGPSVLKGDEPLMPLSQGIPFIDTAWLSQIVGYACFQKFGITSMQFLFAISVTACLGLLAWRFFQRSNSVFLTLSGLGAFLVVSWQQVFVNTPNFMVPSTLIRPQLAGLFCFTLVFVCLTSRRWRGIYWILIPVTFALWANLHGSFFAGLTLLSCFLIGRAVDVERHVPHWKAIFRDRYTLRYFLLLELSAIAVLLNPYGLQIYSAVLAVSSNPNLAGLIEWDPLTLRSTQGASMAFASVVLMFLYRWSPRRVQSVEVLLLLGFGGLTLYYSRFMTWWSPVAAYCLVLHGNAVLKEDRKNRPALAPPVRTSLHTVVWLGMAFICFAITPFAGKAMHNRETDLADAVGLRTPIAAVEHLNQRMAENALPGGLIFNSMEDGDYLLFAGPPKVPVMVASHVQFIPETIWRQYREISNLQAEYRVINDLLEVYGVNILFLSKSQHPDAIEQFQSDTQWRTEYQDDRAAILVRKSPI